ncbi:hypothetical protein RB195_021102 [Necator americanus]|uniref:Uncharacterized protein n=1 Tax=Necator americanus TaxID=51031 RepID=A0ABR1EAI8_NECAM
MVHVSSCKTTEGDVAFHYHIRVEFTINLLKCFSSSSQYMFGYEKISRTTPERTFRRAQAQLSSLSVDSDEVWINLKTTFINTSSIVVAVTIRGNLGSGGGAFTRPVPLPSLPPTAGYTQPSDCPLVFLKLCVKAAFEIFDVLNPLQRK